MTAALARIALAAGAGLSPGLTQAAEAPPLAGCYARIYDAQHLAVHKDQLVTRATLSITADPRERINSPSADATFKLWVRGEKQSFDSLGACSSDGKTLACSGSLSAAETDICRAKRDGVHECRIDSGNPGSFKIEGKPDGVLVTIVERLELVPAPYDAGPFLYLSPDNAENHAFLLTRTTCK